MKFNLYYDGTISFWFSSSSFPENHILIEYIDLSKFSKKLRLLRKNRLLKLGIIKSMVTMVDLRLFLYWGLIQILPTYMEV